MFGKTVVVCGPGDEGSVVFRDIGGGRAGRVEQAGADAVPETVQTAFFERHVSGGETDVRVMART
jgi:hypothetical protein